MLTSTPQHQLPWRKTKHRFVLYTSFCLLLPLVGFAQTVIEKTVSTPPVTAYAIDRRSDFYLAFSNGTVARFDSTGLENQRFSPSRVGQVTLLEAWNPLRIFVFYEEFQSILILDRFLTETSAYSLEDKVPGFVTLACPSQDGSFWLVDRTFNGLLKFDPVAERVVYRVPFGSVAAVHSEVLYLREYQNLLFVSLDQNQIIYFDNLGNYLGVVETSTPVRFFSFLKDSLLFTEGNVLRAVNLYSGTEEKKELPSGDVSVLAAGTRLIAVKSEGGFDLLR